MSSRRGNVIPKIESRERPSPRILRTKTPSVNELRKKFKVSPKGKRKLDFPSKGPLTGKSFYLDLKGDRHSAQLKKAIVELGGATEEFFHKDVTYLVTNRKVADNGASPASSHSVPSPGTPTPFLMTRSSSVKGAAVPSPMSTDSPQSVEHRQTRVSHDTRGQAICKRVSSGPKRGTTDVLSNAHTWGVTIFHIDLVLKWISQLVPKTRPHYSGKQQVASSSTKRAIQGKAPKVVTLQDSYLKVEDLSFKYRPLVHEFKVWPEITFDSSVICPFDRPRQRSSDSNATKRKNRKETQSIKKTSVQDRPKHGYCECCEVRYTDLDAHLKGDQHQNFARTDSNYTSLDKAINDGPTIQDLLDELRRKKLKDCPRTVGDQRSLSICDEKMDDDMNDEVFILSSPAHKSRPNVANNSKSVMVEEFNLASAACLEKNTNEKGWNQSIREDNNLPYCYTSINDKNTSVCESSSLAVDDRKLAEGKKSRPITRSQASPKQQPTDAVDKQRSLSVASNNHKTLKRLKTGNDKEDGVLSRECNKIKRMHSKEILKTPIRLTVEDQSPSRASQYLPKSSGKVGTEPGEWYSPYSLVLDEDTRIGKRKSHKRKRSADALKRLDDLDLSPILPRDPSVGGFISFSDEGGFPTAYSPIYSSLGSSFDNVSKSVNVLVDRIENQLGSERRSAWASDSLTSTPVSASDSRPKTSVALAPGSGSEVKNSTVVQHANEKTEKPVLLVALAPLDSDIITRHNSVGSGNGNDFPLIKRKRSLEDDVEHSKPRKSKRLVEVSSLESDHYRSSVAERVKIQRAISESLQEYERMSTAEDPKSSPTRSSPRVTATRRMPRKFSSSPFVEITNTCPKRRQRAKSDGRMGKLSATCRSSLKKTIDYRFKKPPLSACLIPNDPFSFND